jgi:hypothetical protein
VKRIWWASAFVAIVAACGSSQHFSAHTPQLRVIGEDCPRTVAGYADVRNDRRPDAKKLLPRENPTGAAVCYYGPQSRREMLGKRLIVDTAHATALARIINNIDLKSPSGETSCAAATGVVNILVFSYRANPDVDLWWGASGCEALDNGYVSAYEPGNPSFYAGFMEAMHRPHR